MGFEQAIINAIQELIYFDMWEGFIFLSLFLIDNKSKIITKQNIFHIVMIAVLDFCVSNTVGNAILRLSILIIVLSLYISCTFKIKILKSIILNGKNVLIFLVLETILDIIFNQFVHLELLGLQNDLNKFILMIPVKLLEIIFIYVYYYKKKGGEIHYEKNS